MRNATWQGIQTVIRSFWMGHIKEFARCLSDYVDQLENIGHKVENSTQLCIIPTAASRSKSSCIESRSIEKDVITSML